MSLKRKISRREFVKGALMTGFSTLLAACSSAPPPEEEAIALPTPTPAPTAKVDLPQAGEETKPTETPQDEMVEKYGGIIRFSPQDDVPILAGYACNWIDWWLAYTAVYNRLYDYDLDGNLYPDLAVDWPDISDDGLVYTFALKKGITFHNGRQMTAADLKWTLDRTYSSLYAGCGTDFLSKIKGADEIRGLAEAPEFVNLPGTKVLDDFTLQVTLIQPQVNFPYLMASEMSSVEPGEEAYAAKEKWGSEVVIGTGPFKIKEWKPGEVIHLERFENYHEPGLPYADGLEVILNLDGQASLLRFESRELEWVLGPSPEDAKRLLDTPEFHDDVRFSDALLWSYLSFSWVRPPFNDLRMRQAVAMAIDKVALCATSGGATEPWDQGWAPGLLQNDPLFVPKYTYNPEEARKIVKELYPQGVNIVFYPEGIGPELGQMIQADLAAVGINAELVTGAFGTMVDRIKSGEIQLLGWSNSPGFPDASGHYEYQICNPDTPNWWGSSAPCSEERNAKISEANKLPLTSAERTKILREVHHDIVNNNVEIIPLRRTKMLDLYAQYVEDFKASVYCMLPTVKYAWIDKEKAAAVGAKLKTAW